MNIHKSQLFWGEQKVPGFWPIPIWRFPNILRYPKIQSRRGFPQISQVTKGFLSNMN